MRDLQSQLGPGSLSLGAAMRSGAETWNLLRQRIVRVLKEHMDPGEAAQEARLLLEWGMGRDAAWLAQHGTECVSEPEQRTAERLLARRAAGEPLPMSLGWAPFLGRRFKVNRHVMIPRAHSEAAARAALVWAQEAGFADCVDVGTGCGNLAISLALARDWMVAATELSPEALKVARHNVRDLGAVVTFRLGSLLEPLEKAPALVVANLPYVDPGQKPELADALAHEPEIALVSPGEGTALNCALLHQSIAKGARACLLEHGHGQGASLSEAARVAGWPQVRIAQDSLGQDHLLYAWR